MRLKTRATVAAVHASALFFVSCTGPSGDCPAGQVPSGPSISGSGGCYAPAPACRSWAMWIAPGWAGGTEPQLVFDRSTTPAQTELKLGARMQVGLVSGRFEPPGCGADVRYQQYSMRSSDPGVLRIDSALVETARFIAVAPGTATVLADGHTPPGAGRVELSICADPTRIDDKSCARVPLVVRVVP